MKQTDLKYYDAIINISVVNLYTLSKEKNNTIILENYDRNNISHNCLLRIAYVMSTIGYKTEIIMPPFKYWIYKNLLCRRKFKGDWLTRSTEERGIDMDNFIKHIEEANEDPGVFIRVYDAFFKEKE